MIFIHGIGLLIMFIRQYVFVFVVVSMLASCATTSELPVFSPTSPSAESFSKESEDEVKAVRWAGVIVDAVNESSGTVFEVLSYPVNSRGRPKLENPSQGRFFVLSAEYVELFDYAPGRLVQVYGEVVDWRSSSLREGAEHPVLNARRINLLPVKDERYRRSNFRFGLGVNLSN